MCFEFSKYCKLLFDKNLQGALDYRKKNMPHKLFKYISLSDRCICPKDNEICSIDKYNDDLKFEALNNNSIWLSRFDNLNDPYEYKSMYLIREELENKGWPLDMLNEYINKMKKIYLIASFTKNLVDNMPMWAHYSNNHRGFCVEYRVLNAKCVYPISYEKDRVGVASMITTIFDLTDKIQNHEIEMKDKNFQLHMTLLTHFGLMKHETWEYEKEYRILYAGIDGNKEGNLVKEEKVGLQITAIYVGSQCSLENKDKLCKIAKDIGIDIYEMYLDNNNPNYELSYKAIS